MMENSLNDSYELEFHLSDANIRSIRLALCKRLKNLEKKPDENFLELSEICDDVKERILESEDESHLSKSQNNCRRIDIAYELLVCICSHLENSVDFEISKTVNNLLNRKALENFSQKIKMFQKYELKKEKRFALEAGSLLKKFTDDDLTKRARKLKDITSRRLEREEKEEQSELIRQEPQPQISNGEVELPLEELLVAEHLPNTLASISQVRDSDQIPDLVPRAESIPRANVSVPAAETEISIKEFREDPKEQDVQELLRILDDDLAERVVAEIKRPSAIEEEAIADKTQSGVFQEVSDGRDEIIPMDVEDWSLSDLEELSEEPKKKPGGLIIDEKIEIPDYAARAVALNRNIQIKRVQVYDGPPIILQAFSVQYLMKTSGVKNTIHKDKTTERLNKLLKRHLITEKKPPESFDVLEKRRHTAGQREAGDLTVLDTVEERRRAGMRAEISEIRELLTDVVPEQSRRQETARPSADIVGIDSSLIQLPAVEPPMPEMLERQKSTSPRINHLQGKKPEKPKTTPPWFQSTRKTPPREKLREFRYVMEKLEEYWKLAEIQGTEKVITAHGFLAMEGNVNVTDYLTLIRVLDKLFLQRKVYLEYKPEGLSVRPFEAVRPPRN